jgi:hypothetical protein
MTIDIDRQRHNAMKHIAIDEGKKLRDLMIEALDKTFLAVKTTGCKEVLQQ